jgi:hypothetical protein
MVAALRAILKGGNRDELGSIADRALTPALLRCGGAGMIRKIALDRLILSAAKGADARRYCDLVLAMIIDR